MQTCHPVVAYKAHSWTFSEWYPMHTHNPSAEGQHKRICLKKLVSHEAPDKSAGRYEEFMVPMARQHCRAPQHDTLTRHVPPALSGKRKNIHRLRLGTRKYIQPQSQFRGLHEVDTKEGSKLKDKLSEVTSHYSVAQNKRYSTLAERVTMVSNRHPVRFLYLTKEPWNRWWLARTTLHNQIRALFGYENWGIQILRLLIWRSFRPSYAQCNPACWWKKKKTRRIFFRKNWARSMGIDCVSSRKHSKCRRRKLSRLWVFGEVYVRLP